MRSPNSSNRETARYRLPAFSWPLAACLVAALAVSLTPGCEDKAFDVDEVLETGEKESEGTRPLIDERAASERPAAAPEPLALDIPGADETGELIVEDPLRLVHADDPSIDQLEEGQAALDRGDHAAAIEAFRKAAFDLDSYEAFYGLARSARLAGDSDLAIEALAKAAVIDESTAEPLIMAARLSLGAGDVQTGLAFIDRAIGREPERADAHNVRGRLWMARQQYHRAVLSFERAVELQPEFVWAWNNKGYVHLLTGRYDEAVDALETAVGLSPVTAYMQNNLGLAYEKSGRTQDALKAFGEALSLRPGYVNAVINQERISETMSALAEADTEEPRVEEGPDMDEEGTLEYVPGG